MQSTRGPLGLRSIMRATRWCAALRPCSHGHARRRRSVVYQLRLKAASAEHLGRKTRRDIVTGAAGLLAGADAAAGELACSGVGGNAVIPTYLQLEILVEQEEELLGMEDALTQSRHAAAAQHAETFCDRCQHTGRMCTRGRPGSRPHARNGGSVTRIASTAATCSWRMW